MEKQSSRFREISGELSSRGLRFGVVVARFNGFITERLLGGALDALERTGCEAGAIDVVRVPGSLEIAVAARQLAGAGGYDAVICLSAIIRGETPHFDYVAAETARGIARVGSETGVPTIFGVLTCNTLEQAINRAGAKGGNKGFDAAMNAVEMARLMKTLREAGSPQS